MSGGEEHVLIWERGPLTELHSAMRDLAWKSATRRCVIFRSDSRGFSPRRCDLVVFGAACFALGSRVSIAIYRLAANVVVPDRSLAHEG